MRTAAALLAAALGGCAATTSARFGAGAASVSPGTTVSTATLEAQIQSGSAAAALLGVGILSVTIYGASEADGAVPELDSRRTVHAQDCSQPIVEPSANLKCE